VFSKLDVWPELTLAAGGAARAGSDFGDRGARELTAALAGASLGGAAYHALDRVGTISGGRRPPAAAARRPGEAIEVTGDTRYDSVAERPSASTGPPRAVRAARGLPAGTFTLVAGSTWPADEAVVLPAFVDLLAQVPAAPSRPGATRGPIQITWR